MIGAECMMGQSSFATETPAGEPLLSLREAARLAGCSKRELRERIERGEIAVRLFATSKRTRVRITPSALTDAGYAAASPARPDSRAAPTPAWLAVIHEQAARLATVEDQRAHLAGQLGAALERMRQLEARLDELAAANPRALPSARPERVRAIVKAGAGATALGVLGAATIRLATRAGRRA